MHTFRLTCLFPLRVVLSALLAGTLVSGCKKAEPEKAKGPVEYKGPLLESNNVLTLYSDSAKLQIKYTAPLEQQYENGDKRYPKGIKVEFYGEGGAKVRNTLRGDYGSYDKAKNLYFIRGNVFVSNEEKQQSMKTQRMYFDQVKQLIYTEDSVRIQTPTEILTGKGLTANQDFSRYTILKPAGIFTIDEASTTGKQ
jgi:LPS export ABC transporter protein LptC